MRFDQFEAKTRFSRLLRQNGRPRQPGGAGGIDDGVRHEMFRNARAQRSSPMPAVHLEDPEWEGWTLCGQRLRPQRGQTIGLLCALSAAGATCSMCRSASQVGASAPDDSAVHVGVRVRIICSSALEGQTGTVTSADDRQQVVTVRIDSDLRHRRGPIRLKRAEVERVA